MVKLDSRNGGIYLVLKANIHLPKVVKDKLIFLASYALFKVTLLFKILSLPAKSTNKNLELVTD